MTQSTKFGAQTPTEGSSGGQHAVARIVHFGTRYQSLTVLAPVLLFSFIALGTTGSTLAHFKTIDPLLYQSYIHDYRYMVETFGYTYYSTRISWIFVAQLFNSTFGDAAGYFLSHLTFLSAAAIGLSVLANRFFSKQIAIYAGAWVCFSPLIVRCFVHDYVDGPALAYGMVGMACVLTASPRALWVHLFGGVAFALSFNAYPLAAILPAATVPAWLYLRRGSPLLNHSAHAGFALVGFALTYLLLFLLLRHAFGLAGRDFELIPLTAMNALYKGDAAQWFFSLNDIFGVAQEFNRGYLLFVALGVTSLAIDRLRGGESLSTLSSNATEGIFVAAIFASGTLAAFLWIHFWMQGGAIAYPFSYIFAMPACGLASCALLHALCSRFNLRHIAFWAVAALITVWVATQFWINPSDLLPNLVWLAVGGVVAAAGILARFATRNWIALTAIVSVVSFPFSFMGGYPVASAESGKQQIRIANYMAPMYDRASFQAERSLRAGIFALLDDAKAFVAPGSVPGLWYKNGTNFADAVGSAFLWLYTRVAPLSTGHPGMPQIDAATREQLDKRDYLILIGKDKAELEEAKASLSSAGYRTEVLRERSVGDQAFSFVYSILHKSPLDASGYKPGEELTFEKYVQQMGKLHKDEKGAVYIETSDQRWAYAALYPVRENIGDARSAFVELMIQVKEGTLGVAISGPGGPFIVPERFVRAGDRPQKVIIPFKRADNPEWLVLRNVGGRKASVVVQSARFGLRSE